ncbi:MAG: M14 family zinc carboxypeptidase [Longimicrobiales bacterium]|nr:M14 family zinc carboxypeptidase [Longimicrobiales bacterium]
MNTPPPPRLSSLRVRLRARTRRTQRGAAAALVALLVVSAPAPGFAQVPDPETFFGFPLGADRRIADWDALTAWYDTLASTSPRVRVDTVGTSTMGRPFLVVTVTSEANQARLERLREVQQRLADPRRIDDTDERDALLDEARAVVLLTHAIHSTEVGSSQAAARIAHRLATSTDPSVRRILDEAIVVQIPSLNPDGTEWVAEWYARWVGTPFEAAPLPWLYHYYTGHDNNRDWYAFTQKETVLAIDHGHNAWRPHVVHDVHQMGSTGARLFLPPYLDPWEPNIDPALIASVNRLGMEVAARMTTAGREGVVVNAIYDAWSPARAYSHYHAGARILSESASADLATPIELPPDARSGRRGYDAATASWNHPVPWPGGRWGLPEIVDQMEASTMALLDAVARDRRMWVETAAAITERAVDGWPEWPEAWVIPADDENLAHPTGLTYLLRALTIGDVEVRRTTAAATAAGETIPEGSWVIPMRQPYAGFAQTLLERQRYPDLREYPGGPPRRPYDVTAHTLPLLLGVQANALTTLEGVSLGPPIERPAIEFPEPAEIFGDTVPRIGYYKSRTEPMEGGWTRWVFDGMGLPLDTLDDVRIRAGGLADGHEAILLQNQSPASIRDGIPRGRLPEAWTGGLGDAGANALRSFVRNGGRLVAVEEATDFVIELFGLRIGNTVVRLPETDFFIPGSILALEFEETPFSAGLPARDVAWYGGSSRAFEVTDPSARVLARYAGGALVESGWALGAEAIAGRPALVEVPIGRGSVVLFGYQPNYRAQTVTGWAHLFRALDPARSALNPPGG